MTAHPVAPPTNAPLLGPETRIPLAELLGPDPANARGAAGEDEGIEALARDIFAHGLLQAIIVRRAPGGYRVVDGERRRLALVWMQAHLRPVEGARCCVLSGDDGEAADRSLAANFHRLPLHPLEQAERFAARAREIGARRVAEDFGLARRAPRFVRQQQALAALPENAKRLWREGGLTEAAAQALASGAPESAARLVETRPEILDNPAAIRAEMRERGVPASSPEAKYVGLDAYAKAGGEVQADLFLDETDLLLDAALLRRLSRAKMARDGQDVAEAEGWGHVHFDDAAPRQRVNPHFLPGEAEQIEALEDEAMGLALTQADPPGLAAIREKQDAIEARAYARAIPASQRMHRGVRVSIDSEGRLAVERGFVVAAPRPAPRPELVEGPSSAARGLPPEAAPGDAPSVASDRAPEGGELSEAEFAAEASRATGQSFARAAVLRGRQDEAPLIGAAREIALVALTRALASLIVEDPLLAAALAIGALTRAPDFSGPLRLSRAQGPFGAGDPELRGFARLGFREAVEAALVLPRPAIALLGEAHALLAALIAGALDLRRGSGEDADALREIVVARCDDGGAELRRRTVAAFDYLAFFRAAPRAIARAAIEHAAGDAHVRDHGFKTDSALAEEAARLARAKGWLPEMMGGN